MQVLTTNAHAFTMRDVLPAAIVRWLCGLPAHRSPHRIGLRSYGDDLCGVNSPFSKLTFYGENFSCSVFFLVLAIISLIRFKIKFYCRESGSVSLRKASESVWSRDKQQSNRGIDKQPFLVSCDAIVSRLRTQLTLTTSAIKNLG